MIATCIISLAISCFSFIGAQVRSPYLLTLQVLLMAILALNICAFQRTPCNLPKDIGPCRFKEPCKPTVLPQNDSFVVVSCEGLFEGCHEDQINRIYIISRAKNGSFNGYHNFDKSVFAKNKTFFSREVCANSVISIRPDFTETHLNKNQRQGRTLTTHSTNCSASLIRGNSFYQVIRRTPSISSLIQSIFQLTLTKLLLPPLHSTSFWVSPQSQWS